MPFTLPPLPYSTDALAPHISARTLEFHHGKHHNAYVTNLNKLTDGKDLANKTLEELIKTQSGGIFNQAAQVFNHTFYWNSLAPKAGGKPTGKIAQAIDQAFGSFDKFKEEFTAAATGHFGSGWAWLVKDGAGKLKIVQTHDAGNPLTEGLKPILTCDVWEHAYYLDYQNKRPDYVAAWWNLVNWGFANSNL